MKCSDFLTRNKDKIQQNSRININVYINSLPTFFSTQSNSPTTKASRQVDMMGVVSQVSCLSPSPAAFSSTTGWGPAQLVSQWSVWLKRRSFAILLIYPKISGHHTSHMNHPFGTREGLLGSAKNVFISTSVVKKKRPNVHNIKSLLQKSKKE